MDVQGLIALFLCFPVGLALIMLAGLADLGHPVDELVAFAVDVVKDRVDHHLPGADRADAHIGAAVPHGLAPRHAAPGVDAGEGELLIGIILAADR